MRSLTNAHIDFRDSAIRHARCLLKSASLMVLSGSLMAGEAEEFYTANVESLVQSKCIVCHRVGGVGSANLIFGNSASANHQAFDNYVNSPTKGAKASRVLSKIVGGSGHGGGAQVTQGSAEYQAFSDYMDLLSAAEPVTYTVQASAGTGGTISPAGAVAVSTGDTASFTLVANEGYELDAIGGSCGGSLSGTTYTTAAVVADCSVTATFKATPTEEEADGASAFVERFYVNILGRPSDEAGLNGWLDVINSQSASAVAFGFLESAEFVSLNLDDAGFVDILYQTLFDRPGDAAGTEAWLDQLASGRLREMIIYEFTRSQEFYTLATSFGVVAVNSNDESAYGVRAFTERFYTLVLGRQPDVAGFDSWVSGLTAGTLTGGDLAKNFFLSEEYLSQNTSDSAFIDTCYQAFFGRDADEAGKQGWLTMLSQSSSRADVLEGFSGSAEFVQLAASYGIKAYRAGVVASGASTSQGVARLSPGANAIPTLSTIVLFIMATFLCGLSAVRLRVRA